MIYELRITKSFKSDYKKLNKQEIEATDGIIKRLLTDETQGVKNKKIFRIIKFFKKNGV